MIGPRGSLILTICLLSARASAGTGEQCIEFLGASSITRSVALHANAGWLQKDFPEIHNGLLRAMPASEVEQLTKNWHADDLGPLEKKFDDFRRHIIEHLADPANAQQIPRAYLMDTFGNLGEVIALAEYRKLQPSDAEVVGDISRGESDSGSRRRPDGLSFRIDPQTGHLKILNLLESKVGKTSSQGFKPEQYEVMYNEWRSLGVQLGARNFRPEQIEIEVNGQSVPLMSASAEDFFNAIYLYQPSAHNLTPQQVAARKIRHLMPVTLDPWRMRFLGISILNEAMKPYIADAFPAYEADMKELIHLSAINPETPAAPRIAELLSKYDTEFLNAALSGVEPTLRAKIKLDHKVSAAPSLIVPPAKSAAVAEKKFRDWQAGLVQIEDPIELIQLRIRYDPSTIFNEFLQRTRRWPQRVHLENATRENAVALITEDRFNSFVRSAGGPTAYLLTMPQKDARAFLTASGWRPTPTEISLLLNHPTLTSSKRAFFARQLLAVFGPDGWGLSPGEAPLIHEN
jgi:hypothetical protein